MDKNKFESHCKHCGRTIYKYNVFNLCEKCDVLQAELVFDSLKENLKNEDICYQLGEGLRVLKKKLDL